jgi:hypothetical protein
MAVVRGRHPLISDGRSGENSSAGCEKRSLVAMLLGTDFLVGNLVNNLRRSPRGVLQVWQGKDLKSDNFGSVAAKGVMGEFLGSVAGKGLSD